jgi:hypothetical protein
MFGVAGVMYQAGKYSWLEQFVMCQAGEYSWLELLVMCQVTNTVGRGGCLCIM